MVKYNKMQGRVKPANNLGKAGPKAPVQEAPHTDIGKAQHRAPAQKPEPPVLSSPSADLYAMKTMENPYRERDIYLGKEFGMGMKGALAGGVNAAAVSLDNAADKRKEINLNTTPFYRTMQAAARGKNPADAFSGVLSEVFFDLMFADKPDARIGLELAEKGLLNLAFNDKTAKALGYENGDELQEKAVEAILSLNDKYNRDRKELTKEAQKYSEGVQTAGAFSNALGRMAPAVALSAAAKNPNVGLAAMGISSSGDYMMEALNNGATVDEAYRTGLAKGGVEVLTEKMFGGMPGFGGGALKKILPESAPRFLSAGTRKAVQQFLQTKVGKAVRYLGNAAGEGVEEVVAAALMPYIDRNIYDPDAKNAALSELKNSFVMGAALSMVLNVPVVVSGTKVKVMKGEGREGAVSNKTGERAGQAHGQDGSRSDAAGTQPQTNRRPVPNAWVQGDAQLGYRKAGANTNLSGEGLLRNKGGAGVRPLPIRQKGSIQEILRQKELQKTPDSNMGFAQYKNPEFGTFRSNTPQWPERNRGTAGLKNLSGGKQTAAQADLKRILQQIEGKPSGEYYGSPEQTLQITRDNALKRLIDGKDPATLELLDKGDVQGLVDRVDHHILRLYNEPGDKDAVRMAYERLLEREKGSGDESGRAAEAGETAERAVASEEVEGGSGTDYDYLDEQLGSLKSKSEVKQYHSAKSVNDWWRDVMKYDNPPYSPKTVVQEIELMEDTTFVRVYDGNVSGQYGGWLMKPEDIVGLSPTQIRDKFALPAVPEYVADVTIPAGTRIRVGEVNPLENWGRGGGIQIDLMGQRTGIFENPRPLEEH